MRQILGVLLFLLASTANAFGITATLTWDATPNATHYECERAVNTGAFNPCSTIILAPATTIAEPILSVDYGNIVHFRLRACNAAGCSPNATISGEIIQPVPGVPSNLILIIVGP